MHFQQRPKMKEAGDRKINESERKTDVAPAAAMKETDIYYFIEQNCSSQVQQVKAYLQLPFTGAFSAFRCIYPLPCL